MSVEIKPYLGFKEAVFIDGYPLPKQTLDGPWMEKGICVVDCVTKGLGEGFDPSTIPYQVKPFENRPSKGVRGLRDEPIFVVTRFYFKVTGEPPQ